MRNDQKQSKSGRVNFFPSRDKWTVRGSYRLMSVDRLALRTHSFAYYEYITRSFWRIFPVELSVSHSNCKIFHFSQLIWSCLSQFPRHFSLLLWRSPRHQHPKSTWKTRHLTGKEKWTTADNKLTQSNRIRAKVITNWLPKVANYSQRWIYSPPSRTHRIFLHFPQFSWLFVVFSL